MSCLRVWAQKEIKSFFNLGKDDDDVRGYVFREVKSTKQYPKA
jgi:hypothetical protein